MRIAGAVQDQLLLTHAAGVFDFKLNCQVCKVLHGLQFEFGKIQLVDTVAVATGCGFLFTLGSRTALLGRFFFGLFVGHKIEI